MARSPVLRAFLAALLLQASLAVADTQLIGRLLGPDGFGQFTCLGSPTCVGTVNVTQTPSPGECTNAFNWTTTITLQGVDLSKSAFTGIFSLANDENDSRNSDGTCNYTITPTGQSGNFSATWNAATSSGTLTVSPTMGDGLSGTFTAAATAAPVFPMTVTGSITTTSTNVAASVQPRAQDVGKTSSLFVFAHAPSNLVHGVSPKHDPGDGVAAVTKDDAIVCVLAQVNSSGQLTAVSASTMQSYLTGVLNSQGQAVQVLNNVPTPDVAGAAVYVGYGSSASAMLASGVYQTAISVPGGVQCSASLAAAPAPTLPGALTGLWWNANESGWGIHFTQRGTNVFAAWYTYDAAGNPKWYVASNCTMPGTSPSGTCNSALFEVHTTGFFGVPFTPINSTNVTTAGTLQVNFQDANTASMTYTVAGFTRTVPITRQPVAAGSVPAAVDYTDLWFNANEAGWGMAIAQQMGNVFLAWYVYDGTGKPVWYVASNCTLNGSSCSGALYRTTGPAFGPTFPANNIHVVTVGSAIVSFIDANNAVLSYTVDGVTATKTITRQLF